jgi:prophage regulatory protein
MSKRFLRLPQVLEVFPVSKSTLWKMIREGRFPRPVKLSARTSAWLQADIDALCDRLAAAPQPDKDVRKIEINE